MTTLDTGICTAPTLAAARRSPTAIAIACEGEDLSYAALEARVRARARALDAAGVRAGQVVGLWAASSADWIVALHAITRLGATVLPLSTRWTDGELVEALGRLGVPWLLTDEGFASRGGAIAQRLGSRRLPIADHPPGEPPSAAGLPEGHPTKTPFALLLTSGTTGRPKAVELGWGQVLGSAGAVNAALALSAGDRWGCSLPLFHVGGLGILLRCALVGATVVLMPRFEPKALLAACEAGPGLALASFVPTMLRALLAELGDRPWPAGLGRVMLGGAAAPPDLLARCPVALASYGLTEASSTVTLVPADGPLAARASSGRPLPGYALRVLGSEGELLPAGSVGRLQVRGPGVMRGYRGDPAASARVLSPDGWLDTGDFAAIDPDGFLHVAARREDLIVSGGENIYPAEVEAALAAHPDLAEVAVVGVAHARWGHAPFAFVVPVAGRSPTPADLGEFLRERLARFKHPQAYAIVRSLPLLANGKVDRQALKAAAGQQPIG